MGIGGDEELARRARYLVAAILLGGAWLTWMTVVVRYRRQTGLLWSLREWF